MKSGVFFLFSGTGCITKNELKFFYTAFMDAGKLGDQKLEEFTNNAFEMLTSVSTMLIWVFNLAKTPPGQK